MCICKIETNLDETFHFYCCFYFFIGGCGACVVLLSSYDPKHDKLNEYTVPSCLALLCSINLCSVTTTEGLGSTRNGFHSIHQRFSGFHASQCGFCTPGMCMSLFSALVNADKSERPEPPNGVSKLTASEAEKAVAGNLCRCTGYWPIVDVCKSFAADVDLEDLGLNAFCKKGENAASFDSLPLYRSDGTCTFPDFLKSEIKSALGRHSDLLEEEKIDAGITKLGIWNNSDDTDLSENHWYIPNSIEGLYKMLDSDEFKKSRVKMIVGNTRSGIHKEQEPYDKYINLRGIPELSVVECDRDGIRIGAAVSISKTIEILKGKNKGFLPLSTRMVFTKVANYMEKVASQYVRNAASLGGNLILAQCEQFPSDIATVLLAVGSSVCIQMSSERLTIALEDFLKRPPIDQRTLLLSIYIPYWYSPKHSIADTKNNIDPGAARGPALLFETYRAAPRPLGNAVAYLNAAFLSRISLHKIAGNLILDDVRLVFGAFGAKHAMRARKVEDFLVGKSVTASVLFEAVGLLRETIVPKEGTKYREYRSSLAVAFFFEFFEPLLRGSTGFGKDASDAAEVAEPNGHDNGLPMKTSKLNDINQPHDHNLLLSSKQVVRYSMEYCPIGEPTKKVGAEIQASGITFSSFEFQFSSVTSNMISFHFLNSIFFYCFKDSSFIFLAYVLGSVDSIHGVSVNLDDGSVY